MRVGKTCGIRHRQGSDIGAFGGVGDAAGIGKIAGGRVATGENPGIAGDAAIGIRTATGVGNRLTSGNGHIGRRIRDCSGRRLIRACRRNLDHFRHRRNPGGVQEEEHVKARWRYHAVRRRSYIENARTRGEGETDMALVHVKGVSDRTVAHQNDRGDAGCVRSVHLKNAAVTDNRGRQAGNGRPRGQSPIRLEKIGG